MKIIFFNQGPQPRKCGFSSRSTLPLPVQSVFSAVDFSLFIYNFDKQRRQIRQTVRDYSERIGTCLGTVVFIVIVFFGFGHKVYGPFKFTGLVETKA